MRKIVGVVGTRRKSPAQSQQPVLAFEYRPTVDARRRLEDAAHRRYQRLRVFGQDARCRDQPLGHERAVVEQRARATEGAKVDLGRRPAEGLEPPDTFAVERGRIAVTKEFQGVVAGDAKTEAGWSRPRREPNVVRVRAREGIAVVEPASHLGHLGGVLDGEREHRHAVERTASGDDARRREDPARRLEADDVGEGGRNAAGAGGVRAEREAG
jgi:hypothetical protein